MRASAEPSSLGATTDASDIVPLHEGVRFRVVLLGRVFVLQWFASPRPEDIDQICELALDARARLGRRLIELVYVPKGVSLGLDEIRATERMVERFPAFVVHFEKLFMVLETESFAFDTLRRVVDMVARTAKTPFRIGQRLDVLADVAGHEAVDVAALERCLRAR
ncbi:MAG TPA: hypothetical protein VL400_05140 [Polyangiaceae bacterium]|nr:hypothetical protein [Polyangiaceae bacterium]